MEPRRRYDFLREPQGDVYLGLLETAIAHCSLVLLVSRQPDSLSPSANELLDRLSPYLVSQEFASTWPGTRLLPILEPPGSALVWSYSYSGPVAGILESVTTGLYQWLEPQLPEDLALLRGRGNVWLGSIAHESDAWLEVTESELADLIRGLPQLVDHLHSGRTAGSEVSDP